MCVYIYIYVCVCVCVCVYVCMYVCVCARACVYVYIGIARACLIWLDPYIVEKGLGWKLYDDKTLSNGCFSLV